MKPQKTVALAGNPNVGKSTIFNGLTGLRQHTGNWTGKTVGNAEGFCESSGYRYRMVDIPGTYSLLSHSAEEEVARDFLCENTPDGVVVVCDATCVERNLNLVFQIMEICPRVLVCLNLMDEAKRKGIRIRVDELSRRLGVPVVVTSVRDKESLPNLLKALDTLWESEGITEPPVRYGVAVESALSRLEPLLINQSLPPRFAALRLLENDARYTERLKAYEQEAAKARQGLQKVGDHIVETLVKQAETVCRGVVLMPPDGGDRGDRRLDRWLTGKWVGYPLMVLLLVGVLWLTMVGANYPSAWLSGLFSYLQNWLSDGLTWLHAPDWLHGILIDGVVQVVAWVVSVMLPPMAIFFPLFTLLEDVGYLPRVAYNLDRPFKRCRACGKQALTMCMGLGCNAVGVTGCRIIDSPRERLLAMLTNSLVPCNGRFPTLIALITMFLAWSSSGVTSALWLTATVVFSIVATLGVTRLLSATLLKGVPSAFTLELPPFRKPQVGKVILRSVLDRTLFVLGRAVAVAAPAGAVIWVLANVTVGETTLLSHFSAFLDPFAKGMGMDGVILTAFILGFPAGEIVLPLMLMGYASSGVLQEAASLEAMRTVLVQNGWTPLTAVCVMVFSLLHFPCSTTVLTIYKESRSVKWTAVAFLLPTVLGCAVCMVISAVGRLL